MIPRADIPHADRAADGFLHVNTDEPFGIVYLEAMTTGLRVVAHNGPNTRAIFKHAGVLVDTTKTESVVEAVLVTANHEVSATAGRARQIFDWQVVVQHYGAALEQVAPGALAVGVPARTTHPSPAE